MATVLQYKTNTVYLPDPEVDNQKNKEIAMQVKYAMDGTKYTYNFVTDEVTLNYSFSNLRLQTYHALLAFLRIAGPYKIRMTNFKNELYEGYLTNNPQEIVIQGPDSPCIEYAATTLTFRGKYIGTGVL